MTSLTPPAQKMSVVESSGEQGQLGKLSDSGPHSLKSGHVGIFSLINSESLHSIIISSFLQSRFSLDIECHKDCKEEYFVDIYHATLTMQWLEEEKEGEDAR